ncbi:putative acetyltransferase [Nocardiopsis mwathae]|uniref:Putative acetyltransferase n=1 Tax=Nocardiopsis mwathae TaxID=1472723 RepID=A0A7W9YHB6_9ACTN|nr:N-acetyltransferase [Nocardiopsis mwathae]MBB6171236.1 putative acetyltransferase [Nocardiopsis mwathae]
MIRRETPADAPAIRAVTAAAFGAAPYSAPPVEPGGPPGEATLVEWLRADPGWIPELSLVAVDGGGEDGGGAVIGHVVCTRGRLDGVAALGLGPLSVLPDRQRAGVGAALMHTVLGAADARGEPLVCLLGDPDYYAGFGFRPASDFAIRGADPDWGDHFQARALSTYDLSMTGTFAYARPYGRL